MNRLDKIFTDLKQKNEKALVGFVTAGDPGIPESLEIILKMCDAGLNILELGTPFSDPTADGPVIQRSSARALDKGIKLKDVLEMTYTIRQKSDIPIILFGYYNPIHAFGIPSFYKAATKAGADGVTSQWPDNNLPLIRLVAPTTPKERMAKIAATASGFLYLVSKTGVTGSDGLDTDNIGSYVESLRNVSKLPICVGFGISSPDDVAAISTIADGVVIGSAFERLIEDNLDSPDIATILADKVSEFKNATIMK
ncbi:MAG: tryptophan synthase subunit alpha [Deltaproteobacteria bacterium]|nr:tryptophan synthase subunit alpha [Deltaproteobacteria bacterium]